MRRVKKRKSAEDRIIDGIVYTILILLTIVTIVPFLQVVTISLSPVEVVNKFGLHLFPTKINFEGYIRVFNYRLIWTSYFNTIMRTLIGTVLGLLLYIMGGYPLSKKYLPNRKFWTVFVIFTMYFQGGLIPSYLLISNTLHLKDSMAALILPGVINVFTLIIVKNYFSSLPEELEESAKIDGASDIYILFKVVVPLSKPVLATVSLWTIVFHWNSWFDCMIYINSESKYILQYVLRKIVLEGTMEDLTTMDQFYVDKSTMKMATLVVSMIPIIIIYPFIQKYFVKGIMIGAVKG